VDNSIRSKELQVVSETLRKGDEGLGIFFFFQKGFFFECRGEDGSILPLFKGVFSLRDWEK
jgi:hypothetical protein